MEVNLDTKANKSKWQNKHRVLTDPGKREKSGNFILHAPDRMDGGDTTMSVLNYLFHRQICQTYNERCFAEMIGPLSKIKKTTKVFLKSHLKIEQIPGKTLEFYVESCVGTKLKH